MSSSQKLEDYCQSETSLIYLPKANFTTIWHLAGGNIGPGRQEIKVELDHNEFMADSQLALCIWK